MRAFVFFTSLCFSLSSVAHDLTLDDLKILSEKSQHKELLEKATDVTPEKRDDAWEKLVTHSAEQMIAEDAEGDLFLAYDVAKVRVQRFPHLMKNEAYKKAHATLILDAAQGCFNRAHERLRRPNKGESGFELCVRMGKALRKLKPGAATLEKLTSVLWRGGAKTQSVLALNEQLRATPKAKREAACEKDSALSTTEFSLKMKPKSEGAKAGIEIASKYCADLYAEDLALNVSRSSNENVAKNICPMLLKQKSTKGLLKKRCLKVLKAG